MVVGRFGSFWVFPRFNFEGIDMFTSHAGPQPVLSQKTVHQKLLHYHIAVFKAKFKRSLKNIKTLADNRRQLLNSFHGVSFSLFKPTRLNTLGDANHFVRAKSLAREKPLLN